MLQEEVTLERSLDSAADVLRSKMDANEYKNYILGTIFYKYLSDSMLYYVAELLEEENVSLEEAQKLYEENQDDPDLIDELNKYASTDTPKSSPILHQILDIAERGCSLGIILFSAEQFRSAIHNRVIQFLSFSIFAR